MSLRDKLERGQDIKTSMGDRTRELRVIEPQFGFAVVLADRKKYLGNGGGNSDIEVFYLHENGHEINPNGEIVSLHNTSSEIFRNTIAHKDSVYNEIKSILVEGD